MRSDSWRSIEQDTENALRPIQRNSMALLAGHQRYTYCSSVCNRALCADAPIDRQSDMVHDTQQNHGCLSHVDPIGPGY